MRAKFALDFRQDFWRNMDEQIVNKYERTKTVKLTFSKDHCLGYIDFLDLTRERDDYTGPELPLTFMWSGTGSYLYPYNINIYDPLLRSVVKLFHDTSTQEQISKFYKNLNMLANRISFHDFSNTTFRCISEVLEAIHKANTKIFMKNRYKIYLYIYETQIKRGAEYKKEFMRKFPLNIKILKPEFEAILTALIDDIKVKIIRKTHDVRFAMVIDHFDSKF